MHDRFHAFMYNLTTRLTKLLQSITRYHFEQIASVTSDKANLRLRNILVRPSELVFLQMEYASCSESPQSAWRAVIPIVTVDYKYSCLVNGKQTAPYRTHGVQHIPFSHAKHWSTKRLLARNAAQTDATARVNLWGPRRALTSYLHHGGMYMNQEAPYVVIDKFDNTQLHAAGNWMTFTQPGVTEGRTWRHQ